MNLSDTNSIAGYLVLVKTYMGVTRGTQSDNSMYQCTKSAFSDGEKGERFTDKSFIHVKIC